MPVATRRAVFERDGFACRNCAKTETLTIDHIVPRSKSGTDDMDNLQVLCSTCNSSKFTNESGIDRARVLVACRMRAPAIALIEEMAKTEGTTRSEMIRKLLAEAVAARKAKR